MTQEVAYESLPFAMRSLLHGRIGAFLERAEAGELERLIPLLEHHYWRSDLEDKKREYLRKAAEQAQTSYANEAAITYLDRLITLIDGLERVEAMLMLAKILQLTGNLSRAESLLGEAREAAVELSAERLVARCDHGLAETARRLGRFDDATASLDRAVERYTMLDDRAGTADVYHLAGTIANQQGEHDMARERYLRSLGIREELGDRAGVANLLTNLGIVATGSGDLEDARSYLERAAVIYRDLGDRRGSSIAATNLAWASMIAGEPDAARRYSEQAVALAIEIGDRFNIAIGHNNLGNALRQLGEAGRAGEEYAAAVAGYQELDDRWGFAFLLEDVALLAAASGQGEDAMRLIGAADTLRGEIRAPREESLEREIAAGMQDVHAATSSEDAERAGREGAALPTEQAVQLALNVCERARS
jgi:tetratricopeptide (TPR) repeat protein